MKTYKLSFGIATLAFLATTTSVFAFAGCGGDDSSNPTPTQQDSGADSATKDSGKDGGKKDTGPQGDDSSTDSPTGDDGADVTTGDDGGEDAGDGSEDAVSLDTGPNCVSDSSTCNSCYDDAQAAENPFNACSQYTKDCVPFDKTRVPAGAVGKL
jgi:hypothetical protein